MTYIKVTVLYSSEFFDEVVGYSEEYGTVAGFIHPGKFLDSYPSQSNHILVHEDHIFPISNDKTYTVLPHMRYGSIALYINALFPCHDFVLNASKAIVRLFERTINYKAPKSFCHTVTITQNALEIDNEVISLEEKGIVGCIDKSFIQSAINLSNASSIVVHELTDIQHRPHNNGFFFHIYKFS